MNAAPAMPGLQELQLFDSCVTLGHFVGIYIATADELLALMDRYMIAKALVHEYHARQTYPLSHVNQQLLAMIGQQPRLHPVWVIEPPLKPGQAAAEQVVSEMLEAGVAVWLSRMRNGRMARSPASPALST